MVRQTIISCILELLSISCLQYKSKVNTFFSKSPLHYWTKEDLLTTCNHEFTLQTCRSLPQSCVLSTMSSLLQHPLGSIRILQQVQPLGGTVFARSLLMTTASVRATRDAVCRMPHHAHLSKGAWFWAKMFWLIPCPESTCGRRFPAWLLKWRAAVAESSAGGMWRNTFSYSPLGVLGSFSMKP